MTSPSATTNRHSRPHSFGVHTATGIERLEPFQFLDDMSLFHNISSQFQCAAISRGCLGVPTNLFEKQGPGGILLLCVVFNRVVGQRLRHAGHAFCMCHTGWSVASQSACAHPEERRCCPRDGRCFRHEIAKAIYNQGRAIVKQAYSDYGCPTREFPDKNPDLWDWIVLNKKSGRLIRLLRKLGKQPTKMINTNLVAWSDARCR